MVINFSSCLYKILFFFFRLFADNVDSEEAKSIFETNYSHVYYILYDTFVQAEINLKQRGKRMGSHLMLLSQITIKQFYFIFVSQK
jgi:hypothetical protein